MNTLQNRIRAAITGLGFLWGNTTELHIGEPEYIGEEMFMFVALEYQHIRIPCLVVDHVSYADIFLSPQTIMSLFVEPRLKQHDIETPFLLGV